MRVIVTKDYDQLSEKAANLIAAQLLVKPESVLGLATGSSPIGTYQKLIERYNAGDISFKEATTVNLDEYVGLDGTSPQSYRYFMNENLFNHVDVNLDRTHVPNGMAKDLDAECKSYDELIESFCSIDLQLLGIGMNGHVGFNEPEDFITNNTYAVDLTQSTIDSNKRFFENEEDVPKKAITMGLGTILRANNVVMIVSGESKAEILKQTLTAPISPKIPATLLRIHPNFTIIADESAAKLI